MENSHGFFREKRGVSLAWRSFRDGDFEEDEVWSVYKERTNNSNPIHSHFTESPNNDIIQRHSSSPLMIPRQASGNNSRQQKSAPVSVPDWSQVYGKKSKSHYDDDDGYDHDDDDDDDDDVDYDDDGYGGKVPPHEIIARRLARSQISSFSVFEGVGRTLKGRDLSKVRNAILSKTGFLE